MSVLQNKFANVTKEVKSLEESARFAQSLQERLDKLTSFEDFMSDETIDQTTIVTKTPPGVNQSKICKIRSQLPVPVQSISLSAGSDIDLPINFLFKK